MFHVRLFTNENPWKSPNEIKQLECKGYNPVQLMNMKSFLGGKGVVFHLYEATKVYGCYVTSAEGDLVFHQHFQGAPFVLDKDGGSIVVEFSK